MSSGGSTSRTERTITESNPPPWVAQHIPALANRAMSTPAPMPYPGQRVAELPWEMGHAIAMTRDAATQNAPGVRHAQASADRLASFGPDADPTGRNAMLSGATGGEFHRNPIWGGALNYAASGGDIFGSPAFSGLTADTVYGTNLRSNPAFGLLGGTAAGADVSSSPLFPLMSGVARGEEVGGNPFLDATFNRAAGNVQRALGSQFSGSGRFGSGAHHAASAGNLGDLANQIYGSAYEADQGRRMQAAGMLGQAFEGGEGRRMQAAGMLGDVFAGERGMQEQAAQRQISEFGRERARQDAAAQLQAQTFENEMNRRLQAGGMLEDAARGRTAQQMQAIGMAPALEQARYIPMNALMGMGQARYGNEQAKLDALAARHNEFAMAPWRQMEMQQNLINPGAFGSQSTAATTPMSRNTFAGGMGGAMSGAALGSLFGPFGAPIGAIAGGLGGAFL